MIDLGKLWRAERNDRAPWYGQYPSELYNFAFRDVVAAHRNFLAGRASFPRFKKKAKTPPAFSVCYTARVNLCETDFFENHCVEASSFGSLIHTAVGSAGGSGGLRTNRSGLAA